MNNPYTVQLTSELNNNKQIFSPFKLKKITLWVIIFLGVGLTQMPAQSSSYEELQAAYLYNFAKYITWPGERSVFIIAVLGETEEMEDLQKTLKGKKVTGKEIQVRKIETLDKAEEYQIIYLFSSASKELVSVLKAISGKNVLVVTEEDLAKKGATISFVVEDDKLRFKLNESVLLKTGLKATDGLLKLAILM